MANLFRHVTRTAYGLALAAVALSLLGSWPCARAQSAAPAQDKARATNPGDGKAAAPAPDSRINSAEVAKRVDQELGIDSQAAIADWQRQLDLLEKELNRPRLRYSELNQFRDRLQRVRSEAGELWNKLQPRLQADKAQMDLFGPAPAAGQPAEPEQTALARAELNYHSSLLSGGQTQSIRPICGSRIC
jgi:potassium efflux system protein